MGRSLGATPAVSAAGRAGIFFKLHEYEHDPRAESWGLEAATALDVDAAKVFKTLIVTAADGYAAALVPVADSLDLKSLARVLATKKTTLVEHAVAERLTGYVVGGISPLGQKTRHQTVIDESALSHKTVFVSGGRRGLDLELDPKDLVRLTSAAVASIRR